MSQIYFISIVDRENKPVHIQPVNHLPDFHPLSEQPATEYTKEEILKLHTLTNATLDIFASASASASTPNTARLLYIQDGVLIYGMQTNTRLKFVVGCGEIIRRGEEREVWDRDRELQRGKVQAVLRGVWGVYLGAVVLNPFHQQITGKEDNKINSVRLTRGIDGVVRKLNSIH